MTSRIARRWLARPVAAREIRALGEKFWLHGERDGAVNLVQCGNTKQERELYGPAHTREGRRGREHRSRPVPPQSLSRTGEMRGGNRIQLYCLRYDQNIHNTDWVLSAHVQDYQHTLIYYLSRCFMAPWLLAPGSLLNPRGRFLF